MKLVIPKLVLDLLLNSETAQITSLGQRHIDNGNQLTNNYNGYKIALRMTKGQTDGCIGFHCDGDYYPSTIK